MTALVTQAEWASRLGICVDTFRAWRKAGRIPMPLDLPGWPRWSCETVERVTRDLQRAGETKFFRGHTRRQQRLLQSRASRPEQGQRPSHGALVSRNPINQRHAANDSEGGAAMSGNSLSGNAVAGGAR